MALTDKERALVRHHLGYLNVSPPGAISLGLPSAGHPLFVVETCMNNILPAAEDIVRRHIRELDCILDQLSAARTSLEVAGVEEVRMNPRQIEQLEDSYSWWARRLAETLGAPLNPFSETHGGRHFVLLDPL